MYRNIRYEKLNGKLTHWVYWQVPVQHLADGKMLEKFSLSYKGTSERQQNK
jgi:hypothetical protein